MRCMILSYKHVEVIYDLLIDMPVGGSYTGMNPGFIRKEISTRVVQASITLQDTGCSCT